MNSTSRSTAPLRLLLKLFPDTGPFCREVYPKHLEFFRAGAQYKQRLFMAANRVGKTVAGAFETAYHLTGQYPAKDILLLRYLQQREKLRLQGHIEYGLGPCRPTRS